MITIGLTGGIASGKSTVSAELRSLGLPVFDADAEARLAVAAGSEGLAQVIAVLGKEYLSEEGTLDRAKVAERIFHDKEALKAVEAIIHKIVWQQAESFLAASSKQGHKAAVLDVPLLIECGWHKNVDSVWLVSVSRQQQVERAMLRSGMTADEVNARIEAQMSLAEKKKYADVVLDNSGSQAETMQVCIRSWSCFWVASVKGKRKARSRRTKTHGRLYSWLLLLGVLLVIGFGGWKIWSSDTVQMRFVYMWDYQQDIVTYSKKNNVDPFLVAAIIKNESNFKHDAVSKVGAVGLMQIMPETGRWIAEQMGLENYQDSDLYQTRKNIRMGCWYVGELEHEFQHNLVLLMVAYNAGRGQTHEWMQENGWDYNFNDIKSIPYPDTREYVAKVMQDRDKYYLLYKDKIK